MKVHDLSVSFIAQNIITHGLFSFIIKKRRISKESSIKVLPDGSRPETFQAQMIEPCLIHSTCDQGQHSACIWKPFPTYDLLCICVCLQTVLNKQTDEFKISAYFNRVSSFNREQQSIVSQKRHQWETEFEKVSQKEAAHSRLKVDLKCIEEFLEVWNLFYLLIDIH